MIFAVYWNFEPEYRNEVSTRFKETGGKPPDGVKMICRWHHVEDCEGFCVCESNDPVAMGKWVREWSDLMTFRIVPVVDDEGVSKIIA
ncbi:DUF3303 domain-containing protein [Acidobacteriota bacterium]